MLGACHFLRIAENTGAENKTNIRSLVDTSKREDLLQANESTLEKATKKCGERVLTLGNLVASGAWASTFVCCSGSFLI
jgi:hypothetical protein